MTDDAPDHRDLPLAEAADQLGVSRDALRKRCDRGQVDGAYKTDGRWLIPAVSLTGHADRSTGRDFLTVRPVSHPPDLTGVQPGGAGLPEAVTAAIAALVEQLAEKDRQIATLLARLDQPPARLPGQPTGPPTAFHRPDTDPQPRSWWRRLWALLRRVP